MILVLGLAENRIDAAQEQQSASARRNDVTPETLYKTHFQRVWRSLRRLGVEEASLEDAAQDVFIVVFRRLDTWDETRCSVDTWVFGVVRRVASRYRRGRFRRIARLFASPSEDLERAPCPLEHPDDLFANKEAVALLQRLLDRIDTAKREIFVLVDIEELSVVEAADALDLNLNTAYSRLRAARTQFSKLLARERATRARGGAS